MTEHKTLFGSNNWEVKLDEHGIMYVFREHGNYHFDIEANSPKNPNEWVEHFEVKSWFTDKDHVSMQECFKYILDNRPVKGVILRDIN